MELVLSGMERSRMVARLWRSLGDALSEAGDALGSINAYDKALGMVGMPRRVQLAHPSPHQHLSGPAMLRRGRPLWHTATHA